MGDYHEVLSISTSYPYWEGTPAWARSAEYFHQGPLPKHRCRSYAAPLVYLFAVDMGLSDGSVTFRAMAVQGTVFIPRHHLGK